MSVSVSDLVVKIRNGWAVKCEDLASGSISSLEEGTCPHMGTLSIVIFWLVTEASSHLFTLLLIVSYCG